MDPMNHQNEDQCSPQEATRPALIDDRTSAVLHGWYEATLAGRLDAVHDLLGPAVAEPLKEDAAGIGRAVNGLIDDLFRFGRAKDEAERMMRDAYAAGVDDRAEVVRLAIDTLSEARDELVARDKRSRAHLSASVIDDLTSALARLGAIDDDVVDAELVEDDGQ